MTSLDAARKRQVKYNRELEEALGGPVGAAAKNPDLTIAESIQKVATACAPAGSKVRVQIGRFTEYTAIIETPRQLDRATVAQIAQHILAETATYLFRLQFAFRGRVIAELGRGEIEAVPDWRNATVAQTAQLLSDPGDQRIEPTERVQTAKMEERQNVSPEVQRQRQALDAFNASVQLAEKNFRASVQAVYLAMDMAGVKHASELVNKGGQLQQAENLANEARSVLENPAGAYAQILAAADLDETYRRAAVRGVAERFQPSATAARELFAKHAELIRSASDYVETLARHFGEWTYNPQTKGFEKITQDKAYIAIKNAMERRNKSDGDVAAALARWSDAVAAQNASVK